MLALIAAPWALVAWAGAIGIGVLREGTPGIVAGMATALVLLPGVAARRGPAVPLAIGGWSIALFAAFPLYFPNERALALTAGLGLLGRSVGLHVPTRVVAELDGMLPAVKSGKTPAPALAPAPPPPVLEPRPVQGDEVVLPYEGSGRSLKVPVEWETRTKGQAELIHLFDTGATYTTLTPSALANLGMRLPADAPEVTVQTAAGELKTRLILLPRLWLGGLEVEGITVAVCEDCGDDQTAGLLGLNVSGRFLVTVDQARHELVLQPRSGEDERIVDVRPWVDLEATATHWPDGRIEVEVKFANNAHRAVRNARIEIRCEQEFMLPLDHIGAGKTRTERMSLPPGTDCEDYQVALTSAHW